MKTQHTKLILSKNSIVELQDQDLKYVNGGSSGRLCEVVGDAIDAINDILELADGLPKLN